MASCLGRRGRCLSRAERAITGLAAVTRPSTYHKRAATQMGGNMQDEEAMLPKDEAPGATEEANLGEKGLDPSASVEFEEEDDDGR
jgi:hypothetical protein